MMLVDLVQLTAGPCSRTAFLPYVGESLRATCDSGVLIGVMCGIHGHRATLSGGVHHSRLMILWLRSATVGVLAQAKSLLILVHIDA